MRLLGRMSQQELKDYGNLVGEWPMRKIPDLTQETLAREYFRFLTVGTAAGQLAAGLRSRLYETSKKGGGPKTPTAESLRESVNATLRVMEDLGYMSGLIRNGGPVPEGITNLYTGEQNGNLRIQTLRMYETSTRDFLEVNHTLMTRLLDLTWKDNRDFHVKRLTEAENGVHARTPGSTMSLVSRAPAPAPVVTATSVSLPLPVSSLETARGLLGQLSAQASQRNFTGALQTARSLVSTSAGVVRDHLSGELQQALGSMPSTGVHAQQIHTLLKPLASGASASGAASPSPADDINNPFRRW